MLEYCGTCGGSGSGGGGNTSSSDTTGRMLNCSICHLTVHEGCTDGFGSSTPGEGAWTCAKCLDPYNATQCCCCETRSEAMMRRPTYPTAARSWIHTACLHAPDRDKPKGSDKGLMECAICSNGDLKLVRCEHANCNNLLHVSCAFTGGCKMVRKAKTTTTASGSQRSSSSSSSRAQKIPLCDASQYRIEVSG